MRHEEGVSHPIAAMGPGNHNVKIRWSSYVFFLLAIADAVALIWYFVFVAAVSKEAWERWEIVGAVLGVALELWVIPRAFKEVFQHASIRRALLVFEQRGSRVQVVATTVLVVLVVLPLYRLSFKAVDTFSGEPIPSPTVLLVDTADKTTEPAEDRMRSGHYNFMFKKPPVYEDSAIVKANLTPLNLFRPKSVVAEMTARPVGVSIPIDGQTSVFAQNGWKKLTGPVPSVPSGCRKFQFVSPGGETREGFVSLDAAKIQVAVSADDLQPACPKSGEGER